MDKSYKLQLKINDIRAIKEANIALDGITVITGENGCGKSTISHLTYTLLKTIIDYDEIVEDGVKEIYKNIYLTLGRVLLSLNLPDRRESHNQYRSLFRNYNKNSIKAGNKLLLGAIDFTIQQLIRDKSSNSIMDPKSERIEMMIVGLLKDQKAYTIGNISELLVELKLYLNEILINANSQKDELSLDVLYDVLDEEFHDKPLPKTFSITEYGTQLIDIKENIITPFFSVENVVYIDTPMVLGLPIEEERQHWSDLSQLLETKRTSLNKDIGFSNDIQNGILNGDAIYSDENLADNTFIYKRDDGSVFDLVECATGIKSFSILLMLYKNGLLNDKTLLIIDEPEAHLHPQWVVEYARLIVKMNKQFGVTFLIASHHPDMISAIKYISQKEKIDDKLHFYLAERYGKTYNYNYRHLGTDIEDIFKSFNIAYERMDQYGDTE